METSSSVEVRLLRALAVRVMVLALFAVVAGAWEAAFWVAFGALGLAALSLRQQGKL